MTTNPTVETKNGTQMSHPSAEPPVSAPTTGLAQPADVTSLRRAKVQEYVQQCLRSPHVEEGLLGAANGLLMKRLFQLDEAIDKVLDECNDARDQAEAQDRGIDTVLRLARQVDRFATLRQLIAANRQASLPAKPR
jgi:hypothetical protein